MCIGCVLSEAGVPEPLIQAMFDVLKEQEQPTVATNKITVPADDSDYFKRVEAAKLASSLPNAHAGELIKRADGIYRWLTKGEKSDD